MTAQKKSTIASTQQKPQPKDTFDETPGYFQKLKIDGELEQLIVMLATIIPILILTILCLLTILGIVDILGLGWFDYVVLSLLVGTAVYGMYEYLRQRRLNIIDNIFPDFIRDLSESRRAGMTFTKAILFASNGNYGILTPEIQKVSQQVSWGASVTDALISFSKRVNTLSVKRTVSLIVEASRSGGNVADVLDVASKDAREIRMLENERKINMATYVVVIYVGMMVFLAIILILLTSFLPSLTGDVGTAGQSIMGGGNNVSQEEITNVFYYATIIQSLFSGLVAGIFEDSKLQSSVKHVFVMVLITWLVFKLVAGV